MIDHQPFFGNVLAAIACTPNRSSLSREDYASQVIAKTDEIRRLRENFPGEGLDESVHQSVLDLLFEILLAKGVEEGEIQERIQAARRELSSPEEKDVRPRPPESPP